MDWAYGIQTCSQRRGDVLPKTLKSLAKAGFDRPHLFVDGEADGFDWIVEFGLPVTCRWPAVLCVGHWWLSLQELFVRHPFADRYALFQDDFVTYKNLRDYLEQSEYPTNGYCNLYSFMENDQLVKSSSKTGWVETPTLPTLPGNFTTQTGRGAVALVFDQHAITSLLQSPTMVLRPKDETWKHRKVDLSIVTAMNQTGVREYVHAPSLVQHTGMVSTTNLGLDGQPKIAKEFASSFKGESFDALDLLEGKK